MKARQGPPKSNKARLKTQVTGKTFAVNWPRLCFAALWRGFHRSQGRMPHEPKR